MAVVAKAAAKRPKRVKRKKRPESTPTVDRAGTHIITV